jgi:ribonucleoside-diphosphate reductase alpha chain
MQAAAQRWIDSSISKTVNIPKETSYEEFVQVYDLAYSLGCKGCTTYRPSDVRGSVLSKPGESSTLAAVPERLAERPEFLQGRTYKIKWPSASSALYLTINSSDDGTPFEVFLTSKDSKHHDWTTALTVMITAIFRKGGDVSFVAHELQQIQSLSDTAFKEGRHHPSLAAYIGFILEKHISGSETPIEIDMKGIVKQPAKLIKPQVNGEQCPKCMQITFVRKEGCKVCMSCDFTTCG